VGNKKRGIKQRSKTCVVNLCKKNIEAEKIAIRKIIITYNE
jgi:hypothetical protein